MKQATIRRYLHAATPEQIATALDRESVGTPYEDKAVDYRKELSTITEQADLDYVRDCALEWLEDSIMHKHFARYSSPCYESDELTAIALRDAGTVI